MGQKRLGKEQKQPTTLRQIPQKGDPRLKVLIPRALKQELQHSANISKRSLQSEVIRRLTATFKYPEAYAELEKLLQSVAKFKS